MFKLIYYSLLNYFRDFEAIFWTLGLPMIFLVLFKFVSLGGEVGANVIIVDNTQSSFYSTIINDLRKSETLFINEDFNNLDKAKEALDSGEPIEFLHIKEGKLTSQLKAPNVIIYVDNQSSNSFKIIFDPAQESQVSSSKEVEKLILKSVNGNVNIERTGINTNKIEFYDVLVPGILGFSIAQAQTTSLAILIATQKEKRIFKRIAATPLSVAKYLASVLTMHVLIGIIQAMAILAVAKFVFNANLYGNILNILLLVLLGNLIFLNLGFISGSLTKTAKAANGIASGIVLPMLFFSGVFFPRSLLPEWAFRISAYVPLTPVIDSLRGVSLYAKSLNTFTDELLIILIWIILTTLISLRVFRFREG